MPGTWLLDPPVLISIPVLPLPPGGVVASVWELPGATVVLEAKPMVPTLDLPDLIVVPETTPLVPVWAPVPVISVEVVASASLPGTYPPVVPEVPVMILILVPLSPTEVVASVIELPGATVVPGATPVVPVTLPVAWPPGTAVVPVWELPDIIVIPENSSVRPGLELCELLLAPGEIMVVPVL